MRLSGIWSRIAKKIRTNTQRRKQQATRLRLENLQVESLEDRTLLSVAPPPVVVRPETPAPAISAGYNPTMVTDPTNPNNMVAVWIQQTVFAPAPPVWAVRGAYSVDGGQNWFTFSPMNQFTDPRLAGTANTLYAQANSPSITFDRQGNFYIVATQTDANYVSGALVYSKFRFDAFFGPQRLDQQVLNRWYAQEPIYNPTIAIDNNVPTFTDPLTGATLVDSMVGKAVYIAYNTHTDTQNPDPASRFRSGIRLMASSDGGFTWTTPQWVTDFQTSIRQISAPQILFTQGSMDGNVESGRMIIAYSDNGDIRVDSSRPDGGIVEQRAADTLVWTNPGGGIVDPPANLVASTDFVFYVNDVDDRATVLPPSQLFNSVFIDLDEIDKTFDSVVDLDVEIGRIIHANLGQLQIQLLMPNGATATLFTNRIDAAGTTRPGNPGLGTTANFGTVVSTSNPAIAGVPVGAIFDDQATINVQQGISDATSQYVGRFQPEFGGFFGGLSAANGLARDDLRGTWVLRVTDFRSDNNPTQFIEDITLRFSAHIDTSGFGTDLIVGTSVPGSATNNFGNRPPAAPNGTAPTIRLAQDNTLGSFSPYQGRIYLVYTGNGGTDTDIELIWDDTGGFDWSGGGNFINDDFVFGSGTDNLNSTGLTSQFTPAIAVDQETGAVVLSWYDARYDASNWRIATFVSISIDGGETWSRQDREGFYGKINEQGSFVNEYRSAIDTITGKNIIIEPIPANMAVAGTPTVNGVPQGFGYQMGLSAHNGRLTVVWAGNLNAPGSSIFSAIATYTAGPRIIKADMGAITEEFLAELEPRDLNDVPYKVVRYNNTFHTDGRRMLDSFVVEFDRPIDATTFTPADIIVQFREPNRPASLPGTNLAVAAIVPINDDRPDGFGPRGISVPGEFASVFRVILASPQFAVGTYSFAIGPNIRDRIRKPLVTVTNTGTISRTTTSAAQSIPDDFTPLTDVININTGLSNVVVSSLTVNVNISHNYSSDLLLTLIHPDGTRLVLANRRGGGAAVNINSTFSDTAFFNLQDDGFQTSVRPETPLSALRGKPVDGDWTLEILDLQTGVVGTLNTWSLNITYGTMDAEEALGNAMDQDADSITGETGAINPGDNDIFSNPSPIGGVPFVLPYVTTTLPLIIPGPYIVSTNVTGQPTSADNLALNKTVSSIDITFDRDINPASFTAADIVSVTGPTGVLSGPFTVTPVSARIFRIGFPRPLELNGQYSVVVGPDIESNLAEPDGMGGTYRPKLDQDHNAGLEQLRGTTDLATGTLPVVSNYTWPVPQPAGGVTVGRGGTITANIVVPDSFQITDLNITFSLLTPNVKNIIARLIAPDGTSVLLFDGKELVNGPNFNDVTLDDQALSLIQEAVPVITGRFKPQKPLSAFNGRGSQGSWRLVILNNTNVNGENATLTKFQLTMTSVKPGTGLGEKGADQYTAAFRIFNLDPLQNVGKNNWTPVGPIANNNAPNGGQITDVVVDPSDPSGNTVFVAGAHSGIWKTTNFLTADPAGPTWFPLTDFGPSTGISVNSIVLLPRDNDPSKTIILAATGDGNTEAFPGTNGQGIGFLRSEDGGLTWKVLDSLVNYDSQGNYIPLQSPARGREFSQTVSYKMVVDPTLFNNQYIVYAAMGGPNGGLYRSLDSGKTWTLMQRIAGEDCTDVVLSLASKNGTGGTVSVMWTAFTGANGGVFLISDADPLKSTLTPVLTNGNAGQTLIRNGEFFNLPNVPIDPQPTTPNDAGGRITLATPALTGDALKDFFYSSWIYAVASNGSGDFDGLYVSKDRGNNWTKVILPVEVFNFIQSNTATNLEGLGLDAAGRGQENYDPIRGNGSETLVLAVDPNDPRIVYFGGRRLVRVDTTTISDTQAFVAYDHGDEDTPTNKTFVQGVGAILTRRQTFTPPVAQPIGLYDPITFLEEPPQNYFNLVRDPEEPFDTPSTILVYNVDRFTNTGTDIIWSVLDFSDSPLADADSYYRVKTGFDPLTGQTRLYIGALNGIFTYVDQGNGKIQGDIGTKRIINDIRNGNIQNIRLTSAGAQPSQLAADTAAALFYASTALRGFPQSSADILQTGNLVWSENYGIGGTEVLTDPTGNGYVWKYQFPRRTDDGIHTNFLQLARPGLIPIGRTGTNPTSLVQPGDDPGASVGQWYGDYLTFLDSEGPANDFFGSQLTINRYDNNAMLIGSPRSGNPAGSPNLFISLDQGLRWRVIATQAQIPGMTYALEFGAPDPAISGTNPNQFIYAGTTLGRVYYTLNQGTTWNLTPVLDGSAVRAIHANPNRGSYEVFVLTERGVYYSPDVRTMTAWTNITGTGTNNLFNLTVDLFGDSNQNDRIIYGNLNAMVVDWRFIPPENRQQTISTLPPALYVAADGGVFRSIDFGRTWTYFPGTKQGAAVEGGLMPRISVTDLALVAGNFDPVTGAYDPNNPGSVLLATTNGRGAFAIRLEPAPFSSGPRVISVLPTTPSLTSPMTSVDIQFDRGVDPTTFTLEDIITFLAPDGSIITPLSLVDVNAGTPGNRRDLYRLTFAPQTQDGAYTIVLGPNLSDFAGNKMNQTPDGINGETPSDQYTGRFYRNTTIDGPFVPAVIGGLSNGTYVATFSNGENRLNRQPFFASLPKSISWTNIASHDFNGDGKADLIGRAVQTGEWWVSISLPNNTYRTSRWLTWNTSTPFSNLTFGDFNGDGRMDIAYRNQANGQVFVGLSNGAGFQTSYWGVTLSPAISWANVVAADFTGDGLTDLAARNPGNGQVFVLQSGGDLFTSSLWGSWPSWARTNLVDVFAGDFTGDGTADLVGRNRATGAWVILASNGTRFTLSGFGAWARNVTWTHVRAADFNGDGRLDVAGWHPGNGRWYVGLSTGSSFSTSVWGVMSNRVRWAGITTGDFTGDGRSDLAYRNAANGLWYVFQSSGSRFVNRRWTQWSTQVTGLPVSGDIDGDGDDDLLALNPRNGIFNLTISNGTVGATSSYAAWMPSTPNWTNVLVGDFNGDGKEDLAYRSAVNGQWYVSLSNGSQAYRTREWGRWPAGALADVQVGDFNGDGKADIVGRLASTNRIYLALSEGDSFTVSIAAVWPRANWANTLVGDFNGDGLDDLVTRNPANRQVFVALSTGTGFAPLVRWSVWLNATWANVLVGDFNGDGRADLVARQLTTNRWYLSTSTGAGFAAQVLVGAWVNRATYADVQIGDLDGDGRHDIIGRNTGNGDLWAAIANTTGGFDMKRVGTWGRADWRDVHVADMDGDGQDDLIGRLFTSGIWRVSLSSGTGAGTTLANANWDTWLARVALENSRRMRKT